SPMKNSAILRDCMAALLGDVAARPCVAGCADVIPVCGARQWPASTWPASAFVVVQALSPAKLRLARSGIGGRRTRANCLGSALATLILAGEDKPSLANLSDGPSAPQ